MCKHVDFGVQMSTLRTVIPRPLASFFRLGSRTLRGGTPKTDFDAILDASLVQIDAFLSPFDVIDGFFVKKLQKRITKPWDKYQNCKSFITK